MRHWITLILIQIALTILLFNAVTWLVNFVTSLTLMDYSRWGVPFTYFEVWGPCRPGMNCSAFHDWAFFGDLAIWYGVSIILVTWFQFRRRHANSR